MDNYELSSTVTVAENYPPTIGVLSNQTLQVPNGLTWDYGVGMATDPEFESMTFTLYVNGSSSIPLWLNYDDSNHEFMVISSTNVMAGVHNFTIQVDDGINTPVEGSFNLTIVEKPGPERLRFIGTYSVINYNTLFVQFDSIYELFESADGYTMTASMFLGGSDPLPSFLTFDPVANTLSGTPEEEHVGEWILSYVATDSLFGQGSTSFSVIVNPCYAKCSN